METTGRLPLWKRILHIAVCLLIAFVLMELGGLVGFVLTGALEESQNPVISFLGQYASFIGIWIVFIGFALIFKKERPLLAKLGRQESGNRVLLSLGVGLVLGLGL